MKTGTFEVRLKNILRKPGVLAIVPARDELETRIIKRAAAMIDRSNEYFRKNANGECLAGFVMLAWGSDGSSDLVITVDSKRNRIPASLLPAFVKDRMLADYTADWGIEETLRILGRIPPEGA